MTRLRRRLPGSKGKPWAARTPGSSEPRPALELEPDRGPRSRLNTEAIRKLWNEVQTPTANRILVRQARRRAETRPVILDHRCDCRREEQEPERYLRAFARLAVLDRVGHELAHKQAQHGQHLRIESASQNLDRLPRRSRGLACRRIRALERRWAVG